MFSAPEETTEIKEAEESNLWEGWLEKKGPRLIDGYLRRFFVLTEDEVSEVAAIIIVFS